MFEQIIFAIITFFAFGYLIRNFYIFKSILNLSNKDNRSDRFGKRLKNTIKIALLQSKILREPLAGLVHIAIFWGFLALLFSAAESVFQGFYPEFSWNFLGPFFTLISLSNDIFCVAVAIAVFIAIARRYIFKIKRLQGDKSEKTDALIVLLSILIVVISLLLQNSSKIAFKGNESYALMPFANLLSSIFSPTNSSLYYKVFWWIHILWIYFFMNYLFYSKHFHVFTSIQNVFFREPEKFFKPTRINFEDEKIEKYGVVDFEDLSWKSIFDGFSCTHCGRCDSVCPANLTGKQLSPKNIIVEIRHRATEKGCILLKSRNNENQNLSEKESNILQKKFIGEYENIEALWQCTTCGACMTECPISIEHLHPIIGMRRSLVLMEANFPHLLQSAFSNMENNGAPWQFPNSDRALWAEGLDIKIASEYPDFEYLFWVGCAGSFDNRAKKISVAFSKILKIANVDFAILGTEELCNGDLARRTGNEYLAEYLIKTNIDNFKKYNVKKILTICPHCYNIFKNEYPEYGFQCEVLHHTEFISMLVSQGKIKLKTNNFKITYHDSCYLGRYNCIYEPPRTILKSIFGKNFIEPLRTKDKGLCCGAGGGMMFLEETQGKRVNIERTEELLSTGAEILVSNCPFCMTMITDGIKSKEQDDKVSSKDLAEIVLENLK
ncbi:MAG: heterodisulfide reductase-related iron-sulfur binding cluster [Ignavibacteria bacterium]|nr:heterodisulfide reductase-related iron-sulfur binding cluster [Ignavibacteria bacterium]